MSRLVSTLAVGRLVTASADLPGVQLAILLFVICVAVLVVVSLLTPPPPANKVAGLTFETPALAEVSVHGPGWRRIDLVLMLLLIACVGALWLYFS